MISSITKSLAATSIVFISLWLSITPAAAHTAFEASVPADKAVLDTVVSEITFTFAGEAEPAGEGFVVLDGDGTIREADAVATEDRLTYVLTFDPPLSGGTIGVRWSVAAPDAHPIEGTFSFTVDTDLSDATSSGNERDSAEVTAPSTPGEASSGGNVDAFLDETSNEAPFVGVVGGMARILSIGGALIAIGGAVFAAFVMQGTKTELASLVTWIRVASLVLLVGAVAELVAQLATINGNWSTLASLTSLRDVVWSSFGLAVGLRIAAAYMMLHAEVTLVRAAEAADPVVQLRELVSIGAGPANAASGPLLPPDHRSEDHNLVWRARRESAIVPAGIAAALASFVFDGHTVTEGQRLFTAVVDIVHVAAGAIWAGGLVLLAQVIWRRHRRGDDTRALQLAVRFSVVAAIALVAAGAAGTVLTIIVLDSFSALWGTPWGQILILKTILVGLAGAAGLYNHQVLIPKMAAIDAGESDAEFEFRRAVTFEALVIVAVVVATASLIAASSV